MKTDMKLYNKSISFKAGYTTLYSDFDGTFMPFSQSSICVNNRLENDDEYRKRFNDVHMPFKEFVDRSGDFFKFIITTGRNRAEYNYFIRSIRNQGCNVATPEKLITYNGGDAFYRNGDDFPSESVDKEKRATLMELFNWDPEGVLYNLKEIFKNIKKPDNTKVRIISAPMNRDEASYGNISLEYIMKKSNIGSEDTMVSFNEDRDFHPYIVFSNDIDLNRVRDEISMYFHNQGINVGLVGTGSSFSISPNILTKGIDIRPLTQVNTGCGYEKTKLIDTKQAVKGIIEKKSDDLVIVAGDSDNDETMLNIFNYLDLYGIPIPDKSQYDTFLQNEQIREAIRNLPIVVIMVGHNDSLSNIKEISKILNKYGIKKIINVDFDKQKTLLDGVKAGIKIYSDVNERYKTAIYNSSMKCNLLDSTFVKNPVSESN